MAEDKNPAAVEIKRVRCSCGAVLTVGGLSYHLRSKKHKQVGTTLIIEILPDAAELPKNVTAGKVTCADCGSSIFANAGSLRQHIASMKHQNALAAKKPASDATFSDILNEYLPGRSSSPLRKSEGKPE